MIDLVPADLKYIPKAAMKMWYEGEQDNLPEGDLERLRKYHIDEISK